MAKAQQPQPDIREIYASWYIRMLLWAKRYFPEQADCEDAVHEAFLRLLKRPDLVKNAGNGPRLEGLLRIVLKSACLDLLKKRRDIPSDDKFLETAEPLREVQTEERYAEKDALDRAIAGLPETTRDILILAYLYGYSPGEIAKLIGKRKALSAKRCSAAGKACTPYWRRKKNDTQTKR